VPANFSHLATRFARKQIDLWEEEGLLAPQRKAAMQRYFDLFEQRLKPIDPQTDTAPPPEGLPHHYATETWQRFWQFLTRHLEYMTQHGVIDVELLQTLKSRIKISRGAPQQPLAADLGTTAVDSPQTEATPTRSRIERLLDPRTLHTLMCCGGGILVVGLIGWLWAIGLFDNPIVVATCFGVGNLALIATGAATVLATRYRIAGRGLALFGCLLLPLNLWFYDAQGLITLNNGGHLWVPALLCCIVYAAVMKILKDHWFVHTFVAGIALTGLLILADHQVARFWEILAPSALLVSIGVLSIHAERLFSNTAEVFNRRTFGKAFFISGHVALTIGLGILLGGRVVGLLYESVFADLGWFVVPDVAVVQRVQLIAMLLTLVATYTYIYSHIAVRQASRFIYSAILMLLWSEIILLDLLSIPVTETSFLLLIASTGVIANVASGLAIRRGSHAGENSTDIFDRAAIGLGSISTLTAAGLATFQFLRFFLFNEQLFFAFELSRLAFGAHLLTIAACGTAILIPNQSSRFISRRSCAQAMGVLVLFGILEASYLAGLEWSLVLPVVAASLLTAGWGVFKTKQTADDSLWILAMHNAGLTLLAVSSLYWFGWTPHLLTSAYANELSCITALMLGTFYGLLTLRSLHGGNALLAVICTWIGLWKGLVILGFVSYAPILAASSLGLFVLICNRFVTGMAGDSQKLSNLIGTSTLILGGVGGILLVLNRLIGGQINWELFALMIGQLVTAMAAAMLGRDSEQRRGLWILGGGHLFAALLVVNALSTLTLPQRFELLSTFAGLGMLTYGYLARSREDERPLPSVSFNLAFGSLLATGPIILGLLGTRLFGTSAGWGWLMFHEVGTLLIGMVLLGTGVVCRVRSTTLAGATTLGMYVVSLITLIQVPDQLQSTAVYMMVGGGLFFGTALLMSIYRDRLLNVPDQIKEGEGVFRVLKWR